MLTARDLEKDYDHRPVLAGVTMSVNRGDRLALVGANGTGKSTLLRILSGIEQPDAGEVVHASAELIGYLPQTLTPPQGETVADVVASSVSNLRALEVQLRDLEQRLAGGGTDPGLLAEYGDVLTRFEDLGGYDLDSRTDQVLAGLGIAKVTRGRRVVSLSGGEKARVALAALLLATPDILLLDEPTNDLDDDALAWLERYLSGYRGGLLFVTHDRDFIDAVATAILELDEHTHTLTRSEGNYGRYLEAKQLARVRVQQAYEAQQREIAELQERAATGAHTVGHSRAAPDRDKHAYNYRGKDVQRAVSRNIRAVQERLARIDAARLEPAPEPLRFRATFAAGTLPPDATALLAREVSVAYGSRIVLDQVTCTLGAGDRVCLTGANGSGKSTLLGVLAGRVPPDHGQVIRRRSLRLGYLPQEPALLHPRQSVLANLTTALRSGGITAPEAGGWLVRWGLLRRDDLTQTAGDLSVGQQRKVELGILLGSAPDALLLDEPTNHISLDVIESLQQALLAFRGPVLIVTHDRRVLREFPDTIWHLTDGNLEISSASKRIAS